MTATILLWKFHKRKRKLNGALLFSYLFPTLVILLGPTLGGYGTNPNPELLAQWCAFWLWTGFWYLRIYNFN